VKKEERRQTGGKPTKKKKINHCPRTLEKDTISWWKKKPPETKKEALWKKKKPTGRQNTPVQEKMEGTTYGGGYRN